MSISIEKISYQNQKDLRILESVLSTWFKNPKELNWTDPRMKYPFKFKNWVALTYSNDDIDSYVIKSDDWIVGMGNMMISEDIKRAHALHIFIDPKFRHKGLATQMLEFLEKKARELDMKTMTIRVMPKNEPAKRLYEKKGFEVNGTSKWGSLMMEKKLI